MSILIPCSGFVIHFNCEQWLSSSLSCFRHLQTEIRTSPSPFQWYLGFCRLKQVNIASLNWSLGNWGKVCVGGGGWACVLGHSRFYILLEFFIAFAPLFRTKEESWVPGLLLVLQEACVMHVIHTHSQTIRQSIRSMLLHWRLETCAMFTAVKKKKNSSDLWHHWWSSHMVKEETWSCSPPQSSSLSPCSPYAAVFFFLSLVVHVDSLDLHECLAVHTDPARTLNLMLMNWGEMFKHPISRVQRKTGYCMCTTSDNNTDTQLSRGPNKWKHIEQEGAETVWTGTDLEKWTSLNWQFFLPL